MHDPRTPEILAWIAAMPLEERLAVMHGMSFAFPRLKNDRSWTARIVAALAELGPTAREHEEILMRAAEISFNLKRQFAG